jgi:hypothetical protein
MIAKKRNLDVLILYRRYSRLIYKIKYESQNCGFQGRDKSGAG